MLSSSKITALQKQLVEQWHQQEIKNDFDDRGKDFFFFIVENHRYNFQLWHEEDKARREDMGFEYVYHAKRKIDSYNQKRNDFIEKMDRWIVENYCPAEKDFPKNCPFNSETPAMMIDRLSILSLKYYHMIEQTEREDIAKELKQKCLFKVQVIQQQLNDLENCLEIFLQEIKNKQRNFKVYYQFKMYNDANLNPQLYQKSNK